MTKCVLIYGGCGALGKKCVDIFKDHGYNVVSIDLHANDHANHNIIVEGSSSLQEQAEHVLHSIKTLNVTFDSILCVAGGWAGGNAGDPKLGENLFTLEKQCLWTSIISANVASQFLKEEGCLVLTGAKVALGSTPTMLAYGLVKAAVHQLTKSLAEADSGLPDKCWVGAILPVTLDTESNRYWMKDADFSSWTSLEFVGKLLLEWTSGKTSRPQKGSLVELVTKHNVTSLSYA